MAVVLDVLHANIDELNRGCGLCVVHASQSASTPPKKKRKKKEEKKKVLQAHTSVTNEGGSHLQVPERTVGAQMRVGLAEGAPHQGPRRHRLQVEAAVFVQQTEKLRASVPPCA